MLYFVFFPDACFRIIESVDKNHHTRVKIKNQKSTYQRKNQNIRVKNKNVKEQIPNLFFSVLVSVFYYSFRADKSRKIICRYAKAKMYGFLGEIYVQLCIP